MMIIFSKIRICIRWLHTCTHFNDKRESSFFWMCAFSFFFKKKTTTLFRIHYILCTCWNEWMNEWCFFCPFSINEWEFTTYRENRKKHFLFFSRAISWYNEKFNELEKEKIHFIYYPTNICVAILFFTDFVQCCWMINT